MVDNHIKKKEVTYLSRDNLNLRGRIIQKYGSQSAFAKHLGKTEQTVTAKLNGRSQFTQDDILEWCNALGIAAGEVGEYFFAGKLSKW